MRNLATICDSALRNLEDAGGLGMAVGYGPDLVHDLLGTVFPVHFRVPVDDASVRRVLEISGTYSKNRRGGDGRRRGEGGGDEGKFEPYGDEKERRASDEMRDAAKSILWPSFDRLEKSRYNIRASAGGIKSSFASCI